MPPNIYVTCKAPGYSPSLAEVNFAFLSIQERSRSRSKGILKMAICLIPKKFCHLPFKQIFEVVLQEHTEVAERGRQQVFVTGLTGF